MMHTGHTNLTMNRNIPYTLTHVVPRLVNSSRTIRLGTNQPMSKHVASAPTGISICAVRKSQKSSNVRPAIDKPLYAPHDKAHSIAMMQQTTVSIVAPIRREQCSSSWKKAVPISCIEILQTPSSHYSIEAKHYHRCKHAHNAYQHPCLSGCQSAVSTCGILPSPTVEPAVASTAPNLVAKLVLPDWFISNFFSVYLLLYHTQLVKEYRHDAHWAYISY